MIYVYPDERVCLLYVFVVVGDGTVVRTVADSRQLQLLEEFEKRKRVSVCVQGTVLYTMLSFAGEGHCCPNG